jgi:hypothetical protein
MKKLNLQYVPLDLQKTATELLFGRDTRGFLGTASNEYSLPIVWNNRELLKELDLYEEALLDAVTASRTNNAGFSEEKIRVLLVEANHERLRFLAPLPCTGPFILYRGVSGSGMKRRTKGLSWTSSLETAVWFAGRYAQHLESPAVYRVSVEALHVLAYTNKREEHEFLVLLPDHVTPVRMKGLDIKSQFRAIEAARQRRNKERLARIKTAQEAASRPQKRCESDLQPRPQETNNEMTHIFPRPREGYNCAK